MASLRLSAPATLDTGSAACSASRSQRCVGNPSPRGVGERACVCETAPGGYCEDAEIPGPLRECVDLDNALDQPWAGKPGVHSQKSARAVANLREAAGNTLE